MIVYVMNTGCAGPSPSGHGKVYIVHVYFIVPHW